MRGMRDLLERIRQMRQREMNRYDLGSVLEDINRRLDDVIETERAGIERRLEQGRQRLERQSQAGAQPSQQGQSGDSGATGVQGQAGESGESGDAGEDGEGYDENLHRLLERMAARNREVLDSLPPDPAGRIKALQDYEFMDPTARQKFQELLAMLQQQMLQQTFQGMQQAIQEMTPEDIADMRQMLRELNEMLEERARGGEPDFERFMHKYGHYFGPNINSLDELLDHLARQMAAMQSLLDSMPPEMRAQLQEALDAVLSDPGIQQELAQLGENLAQLMPNNPYHREFSLSGDEELTLGEAMRLMERLREMGRSRTS